MIDWNMIATQWLGDYAAMGAFVVDGEQIMQSNEATRTLFGLSGAMGEHERREPKNSISGNILRNRSKWRILQGRFGRFCMVNKAPTDKRNYDQDAMTIGAAMIRHDTLLP